VKRIGKEEEEEGGEGEEEELRSIGLSSVWF